MQLYYCWITVLLPDYQDGVIAGLARRGYMVGAAAKDGIVATVTENCPAVLFAISLYRHEETSASKIYEDVIAVLQDIKARYYSVVVALSYDSIWSGANFQLPLKEPTAKTKPPPIPGGKKNMN